MLSQEGEVRKHVLRICAYSRLDAVAAAEAIGYASIGIEKDSHYFEMARDAVPKLASLTVG